MLQDWWDSLSDEERRHIAARAARLDVEADLGGSVSRPEQLDRRIFLRQSSGLYRRLRQQDTHTKGGDSDDNISSQTR